MSSELAEKRGLHPDVGVEVPRHTHHRGSLGQHVGLHSLWRAEYLAFSLFDRAGRTWVATRCVQGWGASA